ncbi:MAG: aldehyde dehydrogenase family protein, partial [Thermodesulfobacteriota bacterium]
MESTVLKQLDIADVEAGAGTGSWRAGNGPALASISPVDDRKLGDIQCADRDDYEQVMIRAETAFLEWRKAPAPQRGDIVRQLGNALRGHKKELGALVSLEVGKIRAEGEGEVQEMIDIADFAVGQSRMLYGLSMHSERPLHRMYEQWHPLGPVGVISAFNFPVAVWSWNAMLCLIAGDTVIWKPSSKAPLSAVAVMKIMWKVLAENGLPDGILNLVIGDRENVGEALLHDPRIPLVSATGSVR